MKTSVFEYENYMIDVDNSLLERILRERENYQSEEYTKKDVINALSAESLNLEHLKALLSPAAESFLEELAFRARVETKKHFGNSVALFTPLYLSNFCASKCVYCGFQEGNKIARAKLSEKEIIAEMKAIAKTGLEELLLLTGEGRVYASVEYIARACELARDFFKVVGVEVYVMNESEYEALHAKGCEFVTVYQETYNPLKYAKIHIFGEKRVFPFRFNAQERAIKAGMRGVGFGALLGIDDFRKDALATALHAHFLQQRYPWAEISLSAPRLRPIINNRKISPKDVTEARLLQILCAYRLFLPFANIVVSTRERAGFRDKIVDIVATKVSAGVSVGIGERAGEKKGDDQFQISDERSVVEMLAMIKKANLQPVMSEQIYVG